MIGIRQISRNLSTLWGNRRALPKVIQLLCNDNVEPASLSAARRLIARGHSVSIRNSLPVASDSSAIPWYTYPFLDYIVDLDVSEWTVLEFGSGQSTHFWSARASRVISYEHSPEWRQKLMAKNLPNVEVRLFEGESTLKELFTLDPIPNAIIVDGWKRLACARESLRAFGRNPIYILENSDWFPQTAALMREAGLAEMRFKGFGPINGYAWCTSLMVSPENLAKLKNLSAVPEVPGGLAAGDYEIQDLNS